MEWGGKTQTRTQNEVSIVFKTITQCTGQTWQIDQKREKGGAQNKHS